MNRRWWSQSDDGHNGAPSGNDFFDFTPEARPSVFLPEPHHETPFDPLGFAASDGLSALLVDGDGEVVSALSQSTGGSSSSGTGGSGSGSSTTSGTASPSPFIINVTYDASVANAPAAFKTVVNNVVQY